MLTGSEWRGCWKAHQQPLRRVRRPGWPQHTTYLSCSPRVRQQSPDWKSSAAAFRKVFPSRFLQAEPPLAHSTDTAYICARIGSAGSKSRECTWSWCESSRPSRKTNLEMLELLSKTRKELPKFVNALALSVIFRILIVSILDT